MAEARRAALAALLALSLWSAARADGDDDEDGDAVDSSRAIINVPEAAPPDEDPKPPLWMEIYSEGTRSSHEDGNTSGFLDAKVGKRIDLPLPIDFYAKARIYRDQAGFFWNNLAMAGAGVRVTLKKPVTLSLFAQVMTGSYLRTDPAAADMQGIQSRIDRERTAIDAVQKDYQGLLNDVFVKGFTIKDTTTARAEIARLWDSLDASITQRYDSLGGLDARLDSLESSKDSLAQRIDSLALVPYGNALEIEAGLVFQYGWGGPENEPDGPWFSFPFRFWGDLYSDCIFQSLSRHVLARNGGVTYADSLARFDNIIGYANPDVGLLLMEGRGGNVMAYATGYVWFDTHRDWWNNLFMGGPGLRWQPFPAVDFSATVEYLWGRYYGRGRKEDPLPYDRSFSDLRLSANFWYGLGF